MVNSLRRSMNHTASMLHALYVQAVVEAAWLGDTDAERAFEYTLHT
jgi:hypothetical protein